MLNIKVQKTNKDAVVPQFAHTTDSGFDFFTCEEVKIKPKQKAILPTGLKLEIPQGWGIQIKNKSGITVKGCPINKTTIEQVIQKSDNGLDRIYKTVELEKADITVYEGTIDMSYRGEIGIMVKNEEDFEIVIPKHTKIAQGLLRQVFSCTFEEVEEIDTNTERSEKGYGSSGTTINNK